MRYSLSRYTLAKSLRSDKNGAVPAIEITERHVAEKALEAVDRDGPESLDLNQIAAEMGITVAALSLVASSPGDLIDLACDQVYSEIDLRPLDVGWPERVRHYARSFRTCLLRHPRAIVPMATRPIVRESSMAVAEVALKELTEVGFSPADANRVLIVIVSFVTGHALTELGPSQQASHGLAQVDEHQVRGFRESLSTDSLPIAAAALSEDPDRSAEFELGLKLIVDGLERLLLHA